MTATTTTSTTALAPFAPAWQPPRRGARLAALTTLTRRRLALSAHTPREIFVPLLTPILFALVIAPALATQTLGTPTRLSMDYMTFVAIGTVGLLVPINCMFAGIGVIIDRENGAQRDLLAAPIARSSIVLGNLAVAVLLTAGQLAALLTAAWLRGADFQTGVGGALWFAAAATCLAIGMYGVAETLANRVSKQEEYIGALPAIAIVPWFFAGSLFPISALPSGLTIVAKLLPLTHALALMRYALGDQQAAGLRDIWGLSNPNLMAALSLAVVATFALALTALSLRVFTRSAVR